MDLGGIERLVSEAVARAWRPPAEPFTPQERRFGGDPYRVGLSATGRCARKAGYQMQEVPVDGGWVPSERPLGMATQLGTWVHDWLLPKVAAEVPGSVCEYPVSLEPAGDFSDELKPVPGHIDLVLEVAEEPRLVVIGELKTVAAAALVELARQPRTPHVRQAQSYGVAWEEIGGCPVVAVAVVYVGLDSPVVPAVCPPMAVHVRGFTDADREWVRGWWQRAAVVDADGLWPYPDPWCGECPWQVRCAGQRIWRRRE